jgi:triosephosphate isomerase (TIM)
VRDILRTPIIAGNWKMHMSCSETEQLAGELKNLFKWPGSAEVVIAPPFTSLYTASKIISDTPISLAAQNVHPKDKGAYTGEISPHFLVEIGCDYVIVGHSERRQYFKESDQFINNKVKALLAHNLKPIVCVGESLDDREAGIEFELVGEQVIGALLDINPGDIPKIVIAYEPVWAIGTGRVATTEQVDQMHLFIRKMIEKSFGPEAYKQIRIQYGGSVKPENAKEILSLPNVDGALVGGASLKAADFISIISSANQ